MDQSKLFFISLPVLVISVVLHEVAHGWSAEKLGDPTARNLGRITLNPLVHVDPFMTVVVPLIMILANSPIIFGGAKPVPVNPGYFKNPRRAMLWVALAGPMTNFAIAAFCVAVYLLVDALSLHMILPIFVTQVLVLTLIFGILINLVLGLFNLIPVPPLDGGRIAVGLLPLPLARKLARVEPYGLLIVLVVLFSGALEWILTPFLIYVQGFLSGL